MTNTIQKTIIKLPPDALEAIRAAILEEGKVKVTGLGIFETRRVKERRGRNPRTGEEVMIPSYKKIRFRATSSLKTGLI